MIEHPILFSGPMVRAILSGQKTVTRRVVKGIDPERLGETMTRAQWQKVNRELPVAFGPTYFCPYGQPGDRLWVRETFYAFGRWETRYSEKKGRDEWHFVDMTLECGKQYRYLASMAGDRPARPRYAGATPAWWKRPAIFMPRWASRILLEIVSVRVERLHDISDEQCIAEGIGLTDNAVGVKLSVPPGESMPRSVFKELWESINGSESWAANPWVWAVEFKQVTP